MPITPVPVRLEQTQAERQVLQWQVLELRQRLALHALLDGLAILVQLVELGRHVARQRLVLAEQAFDAQRHVIQSTGRIEPRAENEAQIGGGDAPMIAPGHLEDRPQPRPSPPRANPRQALMDQDAIVGIQRYHVGDTAQRHEIQ